MEIVMFGRQLFGFCLVFSWFNSMVHILQPGEMLYSRGIQNVFGGPAWKYLFPMSIIFLSATIAFSMAYHELWSGILVLACIFWIRRWEISLWHKNIVVELGKYSPSGTGLFFYISGYIIGLAFDMTPQTVGLELVCGVIAASWILAGWKKLEMSGATWLTSHAVGLLFAERAYIGNPFARAIRRFVVKRSYILSFIAVAGIVVELAGFVFIFPELRFAYALIIILLLFLNTFFLGYFEPEWKVSILSVAMMSAPEYCYFGL